ncbi:MAG TPA: hypothetical protein VF881_00900 [Polyangiaceae bacterium]
MQTGQQLSLFGQEEPRCDQSFASLRHLTFDLGAWVDLAPGWLSGHAQLFDILLEETAWRSEEREMYDRMVDVPRLYAELPPGRSPHPVLERMRRALNVHYATDFNRISLALYRDGRDSVAWHGDYVARRLPEAIVATVSVGARVGFSFERTVADARTPSRSAGAISSSWGAAASGPTSTRFRKSPTPIPASPSCSAPRGWNRSELESF